MKSRDSRHHQNSTLEQQKKSTCHLLTIFRVILCILAASLTLFTYIEKQNALTELRLAIPSLAKAVKGIQEENVRLTYEIERFESPLHLMELMRKPEFSHLKYPYLTDVIFLPMTAPLHQESYVSKKQSSS